MPKFTYCYGNNHLVSLNSCDSGYNSDNEDNIIDNCSYSIYTIVTRLELMLIHREMIKKEEMKNNLNNKKSEKQ
ncbi:Hypothetical protein SRAE_X000012200 [Strongyloides ratti]|uniref:Uncharacterized protein n=1 Tax=Strongyloides ratti TaxID=34506 RepID=A0A090LM43_STRRB|nr:Hypothetical protein SRAE_X000012200 [Strongyloides ratti]CEF70791.1 Hypothetical protein SRAE_X000012200 [Strongyloides ratti]